MTGPLEETNKAYAIAKIAGLMACEAYNKQYDKCKFISVMPTNLYGPGDNFDLENSHLLPALIRKFHDAKEAGNKPVHLWGSGNPRRELMHVDDLGRACLMLMFKHDESGPINIGTGVDESVREIANVVQKVIGHNGEIIWNNSKPDGTLRKCLNIDKIKALGWTPQVNLIEGIQKTYKWWLDNQTTARK
jgi:GDP-L-fucose synthase